MARRENLGQQAGGLSLAAGIIAVGLSGFKPGWNGIAGLLPDPAMAMQAGIGLSALGGGLMALGKLRAASTARRLQAQVRRVLVRPGAGMVVPDRPRPRPRPARGPQSRVCLKPVWPPRPTPYWVGGLPHLPEGTDWPMIHDRPACFLAQIALDALPDTLWQGIGPRRGWLVFFGDGDTDHDAIVLHVTGPVAPHAQPPGAVHHWHDPSAIAALARVIGPEAQVPPRWFLDVADPLTLGAVEDMAAHGADDPAAATHWDHARGCWSWERPGAPSRRDVLHGVLHPDRRAGTTWPDALAIVASLRITVEDALRAAAQRPDPTTAEAAQAAARAWLTHLDEVAADLTAVSARAAYDPAIGAALHDLVRSVRADMAAQARESLTGFDDTFAAARETLARRAIAENPAALSPDMLELYGALWQQEAAKTAVFLGSNGDLDGGSVTGAGGGYRARLLDLPPNPLTGITIGDQSRFTVDVAARDLARADFSRVTGDNTHGH